MKKEKIFILFAIILIILFSVSLTPKALQNDTFYTVSVGKIISENGIDMQDHFSWHNLPYTYPHWLYDLGMYKIFSLGGWNAIYISTCILSSILGLCIFFTNSKISKSKIISFMVTIGVMYLLKGYITARAQLVTFSLLILLVYNIEKFLEKKNIINVIALLVIHTLIANLHVALWPFTFVLYLPYLAEYIFSKIIDLFLYNGFEEFYLKRKIKSLNKKSKNSMMYETRLKFLNGKNEETKIKRQNLQPYKITINRNSNAKWLILIMIIAGFTGLLTPLGSAPYTYNYLTFVGNTMDNINEHLPLTLINNTPMLCTIIIILATLTFTKVKIKLADLFMLGGLAYLMFYSRRQQSVFVLIGSIAFCRILVLLAESYFNKKIEEIDKTITNKFTIIILSIAVILLSVHFYKQIYKDDFINKKSYPVEASEWILTNLDTKNIRLFNEYNYGSYLLYKGIPVFIDSRADLYAPEFNTPTGIKEDGTDIFTDFINVSSIATFYGEIFEKYDITHIILYKNSKVNMIIENADSEKYKELYSDDYFIIYEVNN